MKFRNDSSEPLLLTTPCLFPNTDGEALEVRIVSDQYYPMKLELQKAALGRTFYVKRKVQSIVSKGELRMQQSLLIQSGYFKGGDFADLVKSLSGNSYLQAFAAYFCNRSSSSKPQNGASVEDFCKSVLLDCSCTDLTLPIYLRLRTAIASLETKSSSSSLLAWDFRLVRSFYEGYAQNMSESQPLLNIEKVAFLIECVERLADDLNNRQEANNGSWSKILYGAF